MKELTENQRQVLEAIKRYRDEHGFPPTVKDLAEGIGKPISTTYGYLERLERAGAIRRIHSSARAIEILEEGEQN
jgi:repressor LexA